MSIGSVQVMLSRARSLVICLPNVLDPWVNADILSVQRAETWIPVQSTLEHAAHAYLSDDLMRYVIQ
ncbi:MAG: hypothetical protein NPIRA02_22180 [Nitrospirales bacterium]|nr:MAG: hypothetical protein NPIRA02_22180 [Nitrospirales bacterium]